MFWPPEIEIPKSARLRIEDVPGWRVDRRNTGHIVRFIESRWVVTACGDWRYGDKVVKRVPKRVCNKCRKALKHLTVPNK